MVSAGLDRTVRVWEPTGEERHVLTDHGHKINSGAALGSVFAGEWNGWKGGGKECRSWTGTPPFVN